jgi:hypothetical protein
MRLSSYQNELPEANMSVSEISRLLSANFPEVWAQFDTKGVQSPPDYYSSKVLACGLSGAILEATHQIRNRLPLESNVSIVAGALQEYNFPMYYVSSPLLEALKRSLPQSGKTWESMPLPFPGLFFMLPRGSVIEPEPTRKEIAGVGVARIAAPKDGKVYIPNVGREVKWNGDKQDRIIVFWLLGPGGIEMSDLTFPSSQPLAPEAAWIDEVTTLSRAWNGPPGTFSSYLSGLVANLILVMLTRPHLVEYGGCIEKNKRTGREIWSPTFIGRKYQTIRKDEASPVSRFTELGWRCGHFKTVPMGIGRTERKDIWVDPYIAHTRGLVPCEEVAP